MFLRTWRFLTIMLTGLSLGVGLLHLLEMPSQMVMPPALWLLLLQTLHTPLFVTFGVWFEAGAVTAAILLTLSIRHRWPAYHWTLLATLCLIATNAAYWIWVDPVNKEFASLTVQTLPEYWQELRAEWEFANAARAGLEIVALAALVVSVLVETPLNAAGIRAKSIWLDKREGR